MSFRYLTHEELQNIVSSSCTNLCLYASYESPRNDFIDSHNVIYVTSLAKCFETVVFLTNTRDREIRHNLPSNVKVLAMENLCYDFGLWFRFLYNLDVTNIERICLVNDSCTLLNPQELESVLNATSAPFWGMTDSYERGVHHIQSFFLMIEKAAILHFMEFVRESDIPSYVGKTKSHIVDAFEIGLSKFMVAKNIALQAIFPYQSIFHSQSRWNTFSHNSSYGMWDRLLIAGMPILKRTRQHFEEEDDFISSFTKTT